jgi:hypothetical protein
MADKEEPCATLDKVNMGLSPSGNLNGRRGGHRYCGSLTINVPDLFLLHAALVKERH